MIIRKYVDRDLPEIIRIWNEVVEEGIAFPQEELLDSESGVHFFSAPLKAILMPDTCMSDLDLLNLGLFLGDFV